MRPQLVSIFISLLIALNTYAIRVPILVYHHFHPTKKGSMTMGTQQFTQQLQWLKNNGYVVIPLKELVHALLNHGSVPNKSVVITIDDGWEAANQYAVPILKQFHDPATFFVNAQTISTKNHMSWNELKTLQNTGLFDVEDHTMWHPNFKVEKRHRSESSFNAFVSHQMIDSKKLIEDKLQTRVTLLAWPFGIYDHYLMQHAHDAGYTMAFTIDARKATEHDNPMSMPRYMIIASQNMNEFARIVD